MGYTLGIFNRIDLGGEAFLLRPGLNFYQGGAKITADGYDGYNQVLANFINLSTNFEYLIGESVGILAGVGYDYALSQKITSEYQGDKETETINYADQEYLEFSDLTNLNLNVGVSINLEALMIDLRYQRNIGGEYWTGGEPEDYNISTYMLTIGYMFGY